MVVSFIDDHKERFVVEPICRVLCEHGCGIAPSTYYAARHRPASARSLRDDEVLVEVRRVHGDRQIGRGVYGARKVWVHLGKEHARGEHGGIGRVARCQVERLMRQDGLRGVRRDKYVVTTKSDATAVRPPDRVKRNFNADGPNRLWVVDFTYVPTWQQMGFTAFVSDVCSRRIVGWRVSASMPTELPLDALEMAIWVRAHNGESLDGLVHHSDAGSQYTAIRYAARLDDIGALASIGTVGDSYDNALAETVNGLYKAECVRHDGPFRNVAELELATCDWVHWFNTNRSHGGIGDMTPIEFEADWYQRNANSDTSKSAA